MRYWKFLRAGARGQFTGYRWTPGVWAHSERTRPCGAGFHACRTGDLPYWLGEELWLIDLDGPITELDRKVVAPTAMLVERVTAWDAAAGREFALDCVRRVAEYAAAELADHGLTGDAEDLRAATDPAGWAAAAAAAADRTDLASAVLLCGYVQDAVETFDGYPAPASAYLAARVADECAREPAADGYADERSRQARWLVDRLELTQSG
ncbi:hypothetical protein [Actinophytocola sediminis]